MQQSKLDKFKEEKSVCAFSPATKNMHKISHWISENPLRFAYLGDYIYMTN